MKHLIVIAGPTASGKTSIGVAIAKHFNTCVVSADSRQFYKEVSIGTAKPDLEEQQGVTHHFINSHQLEDEVTAAQYEKEGLVILEEEFKDKDVVVLVGGSGMFVDALCIGLDDIPTDPEMKRQIQTELDANGLSPLLSELAEKDPEYYEQVDRQNASRVMRAVEVIRITGKKYSDLRQGSKKERPFKVHSFVLDHEREVLYNRINLRVDLMMEAGLEAEAKSVLHLRHLTSMNTVGYKELFAYFDGTMDKETAINQIKQNSRRYAKRQLTWLRRHPESHWIKFTDSETVIKEILSIFEEKRSIG
ncbi:MAG: tRNA (adenosine(37)-N6)-dimethylallyltransferase MiaA [Fluviicola sp. XM-24bin1]|nr:MAG: tRNA (adenosine(37)-N6)-dimethylallyltransferase MiaA [Fluviicola sp. XM-24bin1]